MESALEAEEATESALVAAESPSGAEHGPVPPELECMATLEDITAADANYVEYQTAPSGGWHPAMYCESVVRRLLARQFDEYVKGVRSADCEADLKRRIGAGPPIYLSDKHALPLPDGETHISRVWFASDGKEYSAELAGALKGEARQKLWDELAAFVVPKETEASVEEARDELAAIALPRDES